MNNTNTQWFEEAKYGLFIHWGLYAIPGGTWNGVVAPYGTEWIMKNLTIPLKDYKELVKEFNPKSFDAKLYVQLAKKWGMKYITFTAKHHDGFCMYDTKYSDYSIMHTPYEKDVVRQLVDACKEENMTFCLYYSQMQDWEHPDGNGNVWDFNPGEKNFKKYFYEKCIPQVKELLTNYGKIGMIWFDTPYDMPYELCKELRETVKSCQKDCLINGRIGYYLGDYRQAADNSIPRETLPFVWEAPMTLNHTWGYSKMDMDFKSPDKVIDNIVKVVGKGGNILLNVGPDKDGIIPEKSVEILNDVGRWLQKNGDSIYGTKGAPSFPYISSWGEITYKPNQSKLYLHVQKYPIYPYRILLTGLKTKVLSTRILSTGQELTYKQSYDVARDENRFYVFLPENCPDSNDTVVEVLLDGDIETQQLVNA